MSYSRWSKDCEIYSFWNCDDKLECCGCCINGNSIRFNTAKEFIEHLKEHKEQGNKVPDYLFKIETYEDFTSETQSKQ